MLTRLLFRSTKRFGLPNYVVYKLEKLAGHGWRPNAFLPIQVHATHTHSYISMQLRVKWEVDECIAKMGGVGSRKGLNRKHVLASKND